MILRLAMIGFGNVGQEFARLLISRRDWLLKYKSLDVEILSIATKTRGALSSKKPLDIERVLKELNNNGSLVKYGPESTTHSPVTIIEETEADMMIELTPLNIDTGQPAIDHIKRAFEVGMDVVTANKGPIAFAYNELRNMARSYSAHFRFEGTVMDGTPIFSLVERTLPGCEILGVSGILNSTSNFVLDEMNKGWSMETALKEAQKLGLAEADPTLDIDGWDSAAKITALANVLMDSRMTPKAVDRKGIVGMTQGDIKKASKEGKKVKLIASATRSGGAVSLSVKPQLIGPEHPFWSVDGTSSAVTLRTDLMGDLTIFESAPLVTQTAYAIFSDMLLTVESIRTGTI